MEAAVDQQHPGCVRLKLQAFFSTESGFFGESKDNSFSSPAGTSIGVSRQGRRQWCAIGVLVAIMIVVLILFFAL